MNPDAARSTDAGADRRARLDEMFSRGFNDGPKRRWQIKRYVTEIVSAIQSGDLFPNALTMPPGFTSGYLSEGEKYVIGKMTSVTNRFFRNARRVPCLHNPTLFSDKLVLYKFFGAMSVLGTENKLQPPALIPPDAQRLLTPIARSHTSEAGTVPDNSDVTPGTYYFKANHGWAKLRKVTFPIDAAERQTLTNLAQSWTAEGANDAKFEWWKKRTQPCVYLEEELGAGKGADDWKFFVFRNRVGAVQVDVDRHGDHHQSMFDRDFTYLDAPMYFKQGGPVPKPENYDQMVQIAESIGSQFEFMRVDLYNVNGKIHLGELSVVPNAALLPVQSETLDAHLGALWDSQGFLSPAVM